jgi:hypothetical protein
MPEMVGTNFTMCSLVSDSKAMYSMACLTKWEHVKPRVGNELSKESAPYISVLLLVSFS